ncbi:hypothetical protein TSUD_188520 [Trifolium subterraneum]|uniref:Uncharacterized protein n=1 Tax=Trifolium subterraneum TaxID=3900 RepID=A0A2Z6PDT5_TRISU|nr:hypothetical protein TSUD_188520 [Trifolium subterraneum]
MDTHNHNRDTQDNNQQPSSSATDSTVQRPTKVPRLITPQPYSSQNTIQIPEFMASTPTINHQMMVAIFNTTPPTCIMKMVTIKIRQISAKNNKELANTL